MVGGGKVGATLLLGVEVATLDGCPRLQPEVGAQSSVVSKTETAKKAGRRRVRMSVSFGEPPPLSSRRLTARFMPMMPVEIIAEPGPKRAQGLDVIADNLYRRRNRHRQDQAHPTPQHAPQQQ